MTLMVVVGMPAVVALSPARSCSRWRATLHTTAADPPCRSPDDEMKLGHHADVLENGKLSIGKSWGGAHSPEAPSSVHDYAGMDMVW